VSRARPLRLLRSLGAAALLATPALAAPPDERTVVVLLFDGVAPALLELAPTPAFARMREEGAFTHAFVPPFPTISLISGFTISMGCWPEHHGIVTNKFLDGDGRLYDHSRDADWTTACEHLHEVAERQGVRAAALDWYGARSQARGRLASWVDASDGHDSFPSDATRAAEVDTLLRLPDAERPRLILAYFRGPDSAAHFSGMESDEARAAVIGMDAAIARVMRAIEAGPGRESTALFVTTDHGMRPVSSIVNVERILRYHDIPARAVSTGTTAFLYFEDPAAIEPAAATLSRYTEFEVLRREALPDYAHLGTGPRVAPLILSAKPPYFIEDASAWPSGLRWLGRFGPRFTPARLFLKATHGYPPGVAGMAGILYAWGDGIAPGVELPHVHAVNLHPTVTALLGIAPGFPLDGAPIQPFLVTEGF
jgi:predicted AlkP superfamily pyrophosphatase or phosphodiesterase